MQGGGWIDAGHAEDGAHGSDDSEGGAGEDEGSQSRRAIDATEDALRDAQKGEAASKTRSETETCGEVASAGDVEHCLDDIGTESDGNSAPRKRWRPSVPKQVHRISASLRIPQKIS